MNNAQRWFLIIAPIVIAVVLHALALDWHRGEAESMPADEAFFHLDVILFSLTLAPAAGWDRPLAGLLGIALPALLLAVSAFCYLGWRSTLLNALPSAGRRAVAAIPAACVIIVVPASIFLLADRPALAVTSAAIGAIATYRVATRAPESSGRPAPGRRSE